MSKPVLFVVDEERDDRQKLTDALNKRFGADYEIISKPLAVVGLRSLEELTSQRRDVALIIADHSLGGGMNGIEFLKRASTIRPKARRLLLIDWLTNTANPDIARAMTLGELHYYLFKPWGNPEAKLYPIVSELLSEWFRASWGVGWAAVRLIGGSTPAMYELKQFLYRHNVP
jgi:thioredoxin reductase (NADPH)